MAVWIYKSSLQAKSIDLSHKFTLKIPDTRKLKGM